tara:strand:- start:1139 stop:1276 length:138 start_codon:yes stop_codon:yes gene_type:complete
MELYTTSDKSGRKGAGFLSGRLVFVDIVAGIAGGKDDAQEKGRGP